MSGSAVAPGSVRIFDTTLRDGEQAPGAGLTAAEKLEVARQLARLKVDVIEAGFPAASPGDFEAVRRIAQETKGGIAVAALARCRDGDPQRAIEAISVAERPHLHVFIATSDIHLKHKLRLSREEALAEAVRWVRYGREQLGSDAEIEFSAEDASRTDTEFLLKVYEAVVEAGASTVNVPDTVGYAIPSEFGDLTARVVDLVGEQATVSIHCHNDLGLATANTLAAVADPADRLGQRGLAIDAELVLEMDVARGDEHMEMRFVGDLDRLDRTLRVSVAAPRERGHGDVLGRLLCDPPDRLEVTGRGGWEARLDHIDLEASELARDFELLGRRQTGAGCLLAVTQGRVEDADAAGGHERPGRPGYGPRHDAAPLPAGVRVAAACA